MKGILKTLVIFTLLIGDQLTFPSSVPEPFNSLGLSVLSLKPLWNHSPSCVPFSVPRSHCVSSPVCSVMVTS